MDRNEQHSSRKDFEEVHLGKVKKLISPSYTIDLGTRGAILNHCPTFLGDYPSSEKASGLALNALGLRHALGGHDFYPILLLFDLVEVPNSAAINDDAELQYLMVSGHVRPTEVRYVGAASNSTARRDAYDIYCARNNHQPGAWSIWQNLSLTDIDPIPSSCSEPGLGFRLSVQNCLLLPDPNLPAEEIFEFRERRRDELVAFRHHLDGLCLQIAEGGPNAEMAALELERFAMALDNCKRVLAEPNWRKFVGNLNVEMNWTAAVPAAIAASVAASSPLSSVVAGTAVLASHLVVKSTRGLKDRRPSSPFLYMAEVYAEFEG